MECREQANSRMRCRSNTIVFAWTPNQERWLTRSDAKPSSPLWYEIKWNVDTSLISTPNVSTWDDRKVLSKSLKQLYPYGRRYAPIFFNELRASLITFPNFVRWQHLAARNVAELSSSNRVVSHFNEACHIDELSKGSVLRWKFSQTISDRNIP